MHKLLEYEKEYENLDKILVEAIRSESIVEKQEALSKFNNSELIKYKHTESSLMVLAQEFGVTVRLMKIAKNLPGKIEDLKAKAQTLEYHLEVSNRTHEISEHSEFNITNQYNEREDGIVSFDKVSESEIIDSDLVTEDEDNIVNVSDIKPVEESDSKSKVIARLKEALQPYRNTTEERQYEYYYGMVGSVLGFFGKGGYSKTEKLNAIDKLVQNLETEDAEPLTEKEIAILTTGILGSTVINPLLEDEHIGSELKELLTIKTDNRNEI